jgi:hypothetical protein
MNLAHPLGIFAGSSLRRVRREDVAPSTVVKPDPYALLMACWSDFMRTDDRDLGAGGMKLKGDGADDKDVHEQQLAADMKVGEAVNAMVDSLTALHRWAICKSQGISRGWRFPNADYELVLSEARDDLEKKLRNNVATRLYFA